LFLRLKFAARVYSGGVGIERSQPPDADASSSALPGSDHLGHLLWEAYYLAGSFSEPFMTARTPLSQAAIGALTKIAMEPGITASGLARAGFKTQQAASQITGRLERLGFVERRLGSGRGVGLYITASGEQAVTDGLASEREVDDRLQALVGTKRFAELRALLKEFRQALVDAGVD
jgi:DNA-binding MarR family transcriptional regulator